MSLTIEKLAEELKNWKGCDLAKNSNPVLGEGNPKSKVVFIGEAPGQKEDEQGRPFVGPAGKFLDELLDSIGFKREDVYITNIVKYRPPGNRDPLPEEKVACLPWVKMELAIIKPKVIATLGKHSLNEFFPKLSISKVHGEPQKINDDLALFPIYHPAAALHNGGLRGALFEDFRKLGEFLLK
ncbi:uracil-DNA glycosylase [Candidatus Peribacteria bacterium]|jgi:uracil-DNA glycosylase|nr:uracil-DNA glycosylase [Candidatus Peribacteria bacterium]MBT4020889.1 uracil-DNA glycosylase [Candidatus Peribacteria bacterium]MBT4240975.1 uracil-DNA glycosylase [Candidatus Peribacteria bacterium]MBT4473888.1 uracil-DNA glycosylase [Candidatus Peribacteria bacterium]MBT6052279.1 uracil-DNA glycosylase [Candidatus Scalindua sp.]